MLGQAAAWRAANRVLDAHRRAHGTRDVVPPSEEHRAARAALRRSRLELQAARWQAERDARLHAEEREHSVRMQEAEAL